MEVLLLKNTYFEAIDGEKTTENAFLKTSS
jgi:hypothetical protein